MDVRQPRIVTDGGPWAQHDQACAVYQDQKAVINLNRGIFEPSWAAQSDGWMLVKPPRWLRWLAKRWRP